MKIQKSISSSQSTSNLMLPKIDSQRTLNNPFSMPQDLEKNKIKLVNPWKKCTFLKKESKIVWKENQDYFKHKLVYKIQTKLIKMEKIVDAAKIAIKNRIKEQESMNDFIQKKRDMILSSRMINFKRAQILKFDQNVELKKEGLINTERNMEKDLEEFNEFLEANKNRARNAMRSAEDEMKLKQFKIHQLKELTDRKQELLTSNSQKLEMLQNLWQYKKFLDGLTPKEYMEKLNEQKEKIKPKNTKKTLINLDMYQLVISKEIINMLQQDNDDEFQMFFQNPDQVEEIFLEWENKNLFQIQLTNELQAERDNILKEDEIKKNEFDIRKEALLKQRNQLVKQIEQVNEDIRNLKIINHENHENNLFKNFEQKIQNFYEEFTGEKEKKGIRNISPVEMLKIMELKLEEYILEIKQYKDDKTKNEIFKKAEQKCIDQKRDEYKRQQKILQQIEIQQQQDKLKNKKKGFKKIGRQVMTKYIVKENKVKEEVQDEIDEEEQDRLKFFT